MKNLASSIAVFTLFAAPLKATVVLTAGQIYHFPFSSLALDSVSEPFGWKVGLNYTTFAVGDAFDCDLLENFPTDTPFASIGPPPVWAGLLPGPTSWGAASLDPSSGWDDLQGILRFTVVSGSVGLDSISVTKYLAGDSYSRVFSVPEFGSAIFLATGTVSCILRRRRTSTAEQGATGATATSPSVGDV